jgi:hypothetical protein
MTPAHFVAALITLALAGFGAAHIIEWRKNRGA